MAPSVTNAAASPPASNSSSGTRPGAVGTASSSARCNRDGALAARGGAPARRARGGGVAPATVASRRRRHGSGLAAAASVSDAEGGLAGEPRTQLAVAGSVSFHTARNGVAMKIDEYVPE